MTETESKGYEVDPNINFFLGEDGKPSVQLGTSSSAPCQCGGSCKCNEVWPGWYKIIMWMNVPFIVIGLGIVIFSAAMTVNALVEMADNKVAFGMVASGGMVFIIGFIGCFGGGKQNKWILHVYWVLVLVSLIGATGTSCWMLVVESDRVDILTEGWTHAPIKLRNEVQSDLGCCGFVSFNDTYEEGIVCPPVSIGPETACYDLILSEYSLYFQIVGYSGVGVAGFLFLTWIVTSWVAGPGPLKTLLKYIVKKLFSKSLKTAKKVVF